MTLVVDASVVVSALAGQDELREWASQLLSSDEIVAPHFMPVEVAHILRSSVIAGDLSADSASLAHSDLVAMPVELFPYGPLARRVWELRANVTPYDAWYVALAEVLDAPLATLDSRLTRAPGPRCQFLAFEG